MPLGNKPFPEALLTAVWRHLAAMANYNVGALLMCAPTFSGTAKTHIYGLGVKVAQPVVSVLVFALYCYNTNNVAICILQTILYTLYTVPNPGEPLDEIKLAFAI